MSELHEDGVGVLGFVAHAAEMDSGEACEGKQDEQSDVLAYAAWGVEEPVAFVQE